MSSLIVRLHTQTMQNAQARTKEQSPDFVLSFGSTRHALACGSVRFGEVCFGSIVLASGSEPRLKEVQAPSERFFFDNIHVFIGINI